MLRRSLDFNSDVPYLKYGRMSTEEQNKRSPDQQFDEISRELTRQRRCWTHLGDYRDDGISGRYVRNRPGFQRMLRDIRIGLVKPKAILVDSWERFGRSEELAALRQELWTKDRIMILTANTQFSDPTTDTGKMVAMFEQVRATSANELKAREVVRGKRDLVMARHWPGGPIPFGLRGKKIIVPMGERELVFTDLEPDPKTDWIVVEILHLAKNHGSWGVPMITRTINSNPAIPEEFKPINESTVGYILDNPIYVGDMLWNEHCTGIENDVRKIERNPDADIVFVPDFCKAIYPRADWEQVQKFRKARSDSVKLARKNKRIAREAGEEPPDPTSGTARKYLLTGLVFCDCCNARMQPVSTTASGASRYAYYRCPRRGGGGCRNGSYIREDKLRLAVVARLRSRLLPLAAANSNDPPVDAPPWLGELLNEICVQYVKLCGGAPDRRPGMQARIKELEELKAGWMHSLGRNLPEPLRVQMQGQWTGADQEIKNLTADLGRIAGESVAFEEVVDVRKVLPRLQRLWEVLAAGDPAATNLELSLHIDRIEVSAHGRIEMRTCKLGLFEGAQEVLAGGQESVPEASPAPSLDAYRVRSRHRTRHKVDPDHEAAVGSIQIDRAADPQRFQGLAEQWFWTDPLEITPGSCWSTDNAPAVANRWKEDPEHWTICALAEEFHVSRPTVSKALKIGQKALGLNLAQRKIAPRGVQDHRQIVDTVAKSYFEDHLSIRAIARQLSVNQVTVSKALDEWYARRGQDRPDGRKTRTKRVAPPAPDMPQGEKPANPQVPPAYGAPPEDGDPGGGGKRAA